MKELNSPVQEKQTGQAQPQLVEQIQTPSPTSKLDEEAGQEQGATDKRVSKSNYVEILFRTFEDGCLKTVHRQTSNPAESLAVEDKAREFMLQGLRPFSTHVKPLLPRDVFKSALSSGINTVLLLPDDNVDINENLRQAILQLKSS